MKRSNRFPSNWIVIFIVSPSITTLIFNLFLNGKLLGVGTATPYAIAQDLSE